MPWRNALEKFVSAVRGCPRSCARTNPWFRGRILGENVRKNRPLVPRSNIAGSWARGGGRVPIQHAHHNPCDWATSYCFDVPQLRGNGYAQCHREGYRCRDLWIF